MDYDYVPCSFYGGTIRNLHIFPYIILHYYYLRLVELSFIMNKYALDFREEVAHAPIYLLGFSIHQILKMRQPVLILLEIH